MLLVLEIQPNTARKVMFKFDIYNLNQILENSNELQEPSAYFIISFLFHKCGANKKHKTSPLSVTPPARAEENRDSHERKRKCNKQLVTAGNRDVMKHYICIFASGGPHIVVWSFLTEYLLLC